MAEANVDQRPEARLLPWHAPAAAQLAAAWSAGRLAHALLVHGAQGLGKRSFAAWLASAVLCESSLAAPLNHCGQCASCLLLKAGTHPDLLWVAPEEGKQQISIDQVRAATERLSKTSYRQGYKVAVIEPAHQMTPGAGNSLLKTLEEPSPGSLLLLVTSRGSSLLPTLRSRCQKVTIPRPSRTEAMAWLQTQAQERVDPALLEFAGGGPLRALAYAGGQFTALNQQMRKSLGELLTGHSDVSQVAAEWAKDGLTDRLVWLDQWLTSVARGMLTHSESTAFARSGGNESPDLPSLPRALNISHLYDLVDRLRTLRAQLSRTALQRELAVASWLIALLDVLRDGHLAQKRMDAPAVTY
jgi:DNA polymerase-3 subunit delta'